MKTIIVTLTVYILNISYLLTYILYPLQIENITVDMGLNWERMNPHLTIVIPGMRVTILTLFE